MVDDVPDESAEKERLRAEGPPAMGAVFDSHRERLRRMVEMRMDHRVRARVDPSDVLQEAYIDAADRLQDANRRSERAPFGNRRLTEKTPGAVQRYQIVNERHCRDHKHGPGGW